jgi:Zn-dependent M28 family amino/carboxypeptidase
MKITYIVLSLILFIGCKAQKDISEVNPEKYAKFIKSQSMKNKLYTFASDEFEGRDTGQPGQKKAAEYLKSFYQSLGINSPLGENDYYQEIPSSFFNDRIPDTENVIAYIEGDGSTNEVLVLTAHYDHIGMKGEEIYNGADDDGSGTIALLEIAKAFKEAINDGYSPRRSIVFLHVSAEEKGLLGSNFYSANPIFPLDQTVANLNIDMIGRIDDAHHDNPNYVYLIGSDRLSTDLHEISENANDKYVQLELDYKYNAADDPNRFYYRSDHYHFAKHDIPIIFYFNGTHEDYHQPTDTADKINYELLSKRTQLVFYTAWEIANREEKPYVDKPTKK